MPKSRFALSIAQKFVLFVLVAGVLPLVLVGWLALDVARNAIRDQVSRYTQQLMVEKQTDGESTHIQVVPLDAGERVAEIARMLGGLELTANTLAHAREMVEKAAGSD